MTAVLPTPNALRKWQPKKWKPVYDMIVCCSVAGWSNIQISEHFNMTKEHVSLLLNTPQAALLRRQIADQLLDRQIESIPRKMEAISVKAVERLHQVLHNDELFEESPFSVVDRGMKALAKTGVLSDDDKPGGINVKNAVILTGSHVKDLTDSLNKEREARALLNGEAVDVTPSK